MFARAEPLCPGRGFCVLRRARRLAAAERARLPPVTHTTPGPPQVAEQFEMMHATIGGVAPESPWSVRISVPKQSEVSAPGASRQCCCAMSAARQLGSPKHSGPPMSQHCWDRHWRQLFVPPSRPQVCATVPPEPPLDATEEPPLAELEPPEALLEPPEPVPAPPLPPDAPDEPSDEHPASRATTDMPTTRRSATFMILLFSTLSRGWQEPSNDCAPASKGPAGAHV